MPIPKHDWPTDQPIQKKTRTCAACGLTVRWAKVDSYVNRWAVAWNRGGEDGEVPGLRNVPGCTGTGPSAPRSTEPEIAELAPSLLYRVTYERVGRRGGQNGSAPPPALTVWALTADALAREIRTDVRRYLASKDIEVYVDLETGRGSIQAGWNNGGDFTIERVAATETAGA